MGEEGGAKMGMRVHELHAAMVHSPLVLLPAAAIVDLSAAMTGDARRAALGRRLWWLGVGAAGMAGVAGLAASQEIKADDSHAEDMMWLHGAGNFAILLGGVGLALWRTFRRPSVTEAAIGLGASALATYTAYLGGEMVYGHGVGVRSMPRIAPAGVRRSPPVLSREAPGTFLRDAVAGLGWLIRRTAQAFAGRRAVDRRAFGIGRVAELAASDVTE
jgi:uncharacterized membrane protein